MLTPQRIQELADPIESVYIAMTNELLANIGRHITKPNWTHTAAWEIQKLSELGQLTAENAAIINKWIEQLPEEIRETMEETRRQALEDIEKQLAKAAKKGYVTPPERDSTVDILREYSQQAADKLNLVNTTMLQSSVEQYQRTVMLTQQEAERLEAQRAATQTALNQAAGNVAVGTETRTQAMRRAIRRIADEGLTGFYDRAGRSWSPEAYVNMDIRTTVHNVAIQSVKNRMQDYNTQVFQVSAHAGARPLCYPYQGKFYSWDNTSGEIPTGNGDLIQYEPLNSTTYGQAAGLFGINCGHRPIPIIPGVSIPHAQDYVQPQEENDKAYAESQRQRALEREIRAAKRVVEMGDDSKEAKDAVKAAQERMRKFIAETGRTRRYDRESLYGAKKAPTPPADKRPPQNVASQATTPKIEPVKVNYGPAVDPIRSKYKGDVMSDLDNAPEAIKRAWNKASEDLKAPKYDASSGAFYRPGTKDVHFKTQKKAYEMSNYQEKNACYFHEYGHNIDDLFGNGSHSGYLSMIYKNGAFGRSIYKECEERVREHMYKYRGYKDDFDMIAKQQNSPGGMGIGSYIRQMLRGVMPPDEYRGMRGALLDAGDDEKKLRKYFDKYLKDTDAIKSEVRNAVRSDRESAKDFCKTVKDNYSMYERTDISDMFNQYMLNHFRIGYPFGIGHENSYWGMNESQVSALSTEAFAEMFSATATQNQSLKTIKQFFPESYALFTEMLEEATK